MLGNNLLVVIPVRVDSERVPNKPLRLIGGMPLIVRLVREVLALGLERARVVVATDSKKVCEAVRSFAEPS